MAKFYGAIGYGIPTEIEPGIWDDKIEEREYRGDVYRFTTQWSSSSESTNDDLTVNNQISIISDPFAEKNSHYMKYVQFMGAKWKIKSIEVKYPRLVLTIGGVYNG